MKIKIFIEPAEYVVDIEPEDEADVNNNDINYDAYIHHYVTDVNYSVEVIDE